MSRPGQSTSRQRQRRAVRATPAPERRRRRRPEPPEPGEPITARRKWAAVAAGTALALVAFWLVVAAVVASDPDSDLEANAALLYSIGLVVIPFLLWAVAGISRSAEVLRSVLLGSALAVGITVWVPYVTGEPVAPMVAGIGAGAIMALRRDPPATISARSIAVGAAAVYTWVMIQVSPGAAMLLAPFLPVAMVAAADALVVRRAERST